jgi:hypothetical protein
MSISRVMSLLLWNTMLTCIWAGGEHGSALQAAAASGHIKTVQMLLNHKADVNLPGKVPIVLYLYAYLYSGRWTI